GGGHHPEHRDLCEVGDFHDLGIAAHVVEGTPRVVRQHDALGAAGSQNLDAHGAVLGQVKKDAVALNSRPITTMPATTMNKNVASRRALTTRLSMISEGSDSAVTAIMKASTVPRPTPFPTSASAI